MATSVRRCGFSTHNVITFVSHLEFLKVIVKYANAMVI